MFDQLLAYSKYSPASIAYTIISIFSSPKCRFYKNRKQSLLEQEEGASHFAKLMNTFSK